MLAFVIISTLFFFGIPLFIVLSILKSEEKLIDASIQRLGGQKAVMLANKTKVKNKKSTAIQSKENKSKTNQSKKKTGVNSKSSVVAAKKTDAKPIKVPPMKASHLNSRFIILQEHVMQGIVHLKEGIVNTLLTLRKKMPGYIYPSRSEMVRDQLLVEQKRKQKLLIKP